MIRGLYTAAAGMTAQQQNIDVISNNIANVNTDGFKQDRAEFQDLMYQSLNYTAGATSSTTNNPTGIDTGLGVRVSGIQKNFIQGNMKETGNDFDLAIANKIKKINIKMIMLSSRKVYKSGFNLKETSTLKAKSNYAKNKLKTKKTILKILQKKILILRISNVIGLNNIKHNKLHKVFIDVFFENIKKGIIFDNKNSYKDFITVAKFCEIVEKLIIFKAHGVYNVSIGKKIFLKKIVSWLNFYNKKNVKYVNLNKHQSDNFTLTVS